MSNTNLQVAKRTKNDEFYTCMEDIEAELQHYNKANFEGRVVYCNTDNPEQSNFWKYFEKNFDCLGLKKLVATYYDPDNVVYKYELFKDPDTGEKKIAKVPLIGNGDFRSAECIELMRSADLIVTNPPFSLFREFVGQLKACGYCD